MCGPLARGFFPSYASLEPKQTLVNVSDYQTRVSVEVRDKSVNMNEKTAIQCKILVIYVNVKDVSL